MELAFLTPLLKDGAKSVSRGIAINDKGFFEAWLSENGGSAYRINEGIKRSFMFIVPVKPATFSAVGNKCVQRSGEHAKVTNVHPVEVEKTEEGA